MSDNFYQPPKPSHNQSPIPQGNGIRRVAAGNGTIWIKKAITLFRRNPGAWISCSLVISFAMFATLFIMLLLPFLFPVLFIANSIFTGGLMIGSQKLKNYQEFNVNHLFSGFEKHLAQLATVGMFYFFGVLASVGLAIMLSNGLGHEIYSTDIQNLQNNEAEIKKLVDSLILPLLLVIGLMIPVLMCYWFAPALIVLKNYKAIEAMKTSFSACMHNIMPFLVYALVMFFGLLSISIVLRVIGSINPAVDMLLSLIFNLIAMSITMASIYTAFDDIFPSKPIPTEETGANDSLIA